MRLDIESHSCVVARCLAAWWLKFLAVACAARVAARCLLLSACLCGVACAFVFVPLLAAFATKNLRSCFFSFMSCAPLSSYLGSEIKAVRDPSMILSWCLLSFSFSRFLSSCLLCFASFAVLSRAPRSFPLCGLLRPALHRAAATSAAALAAASSSFLIRHMQADAPRSHGKQLGAGSSRT